MTDWRAVLVGFAVELVLGLFAFLLPGVGHAVAGLVGGFVAGYLAGGTLGNGAWHGLLAGALGGLVVAVVFGVVVTVVGTFGLGPLGTLAGGATFVVLLFVALLLAVDSAIAGALGAAVR